VETALKGARTYHLANDEPERTVVIGRDLSYHGNSLGALDVSGRHSLRAPYLPWLGNAARAPGVLEYRCPNPAHPSDCAKWHADALRAEMERVGPERVAAFIAEPIGGAASGAAIPPPGYWEAITDVCRKHGVLIIADEVMTGFGRTGRWFASEHFELRPDIMTMAKGASSGYWPLGVCAFSTQVATALKERGFVHGLTFSHHQVGAAAGRAVIKRLDELHLVEKAEERGRALGDALRATAGEHALVGDVRGTGLLWAVELVEDRGSRRPYPARERMAARLTEAARSHGLLVYPSTGCAGGGTGDLIMVGPPLIVSREEIEVLVDRLAMALEELT
jgi:adenosylmethionine-8-amino-7-oxononanoate aminotransferase